MIYRLLPYSFAFNIISGITLLVITSCGSPAPRGYVKPDIDTIVVDVHTTCYTVKNTNTLSCVVKP